MATLNFNTTVTDWTTNSGSATAVPNSIPKTQFESMLTELVPTTNFLDRNVVVNESGDAAHDFRVESDGNTHALHVDASSDGVGIGGAASTGNWELKLYGSQWLLGDNSGTDTELYVQDPSAASKVTLDGTTGTLLHAYTRTSGQAEMFLTTTAATVGSTNNSLNIRNTGTTSDFIVYNYDTTNGHTAGSGTALTIHNATGNVGIGGAADTSTSISAYELTVTGNTKLTSASGGTELIVEDTGSGSSARIDVVGDTTSLVMDFDSTGTGTTEGFFLIRDTGQTTNNAFSLKNNGDNILFRTYDYDGTSSGGWNQAITINNSTGNVGINGDADTGAYDLKVNGQFRVDNSDGSTEAYIYSGTDTSIVHVKSGHTTGYGQIYMQGGGGAKIDMQDDNASGNNDRFTIMNAGDTVAFDIYDNTESKVHDVIDIDLATGSVVINETSESGIDFRVESGGNANMLYVDAGKDAVGIGGAAQAGWELTVYGNQYITNPGGGAELYLKADTGNSTVWAEAFASDGRGQFTAEGPDGARLDLTESGSSTHPRFTISTTGGNTHFQIYDSSDSLEHNFMEIDHATGHVGIGGAPHTTTSAGAAYKLTVNGDLYVKDDDGYVLALFEQTSTNSPENATVILKAANSSTLQLIDTGASTNRGIYNISANSDSFSVGTIDDNGSTGYTCFETHRQTISSTQYIIFRHPDIPPASVLSSLPVGAIYEDSGTLKIKT